MNSSRAFALFIAIGGRIALLAFWIFSPIVNQAFQSPILPVLGILFLPLTALFYALTYNPQLGGPTAFGWGLVIMGFAFDLAADIFLILGSLPKSESDNP